MVVVMGFSVTHDAYAQFEEEEAKNSLFYYSGYAGDEKIELNLQMEDKLVFGSYIMERTGDLFIFKGTLSTDRTTLEVLIFDDQDKYVASLQADLISEENSFAKEIKGRLIPVNKAKPVAVNLTKMAELANAAYPFDTQSSYLGE
ncbi:hypothetical protein [Fulvivirga imtechensis]|nr:hypothetical protein [Fulvivirga imtechensis]